jgi:L-asparaginase
MSIETSRTATLRRFRMIATLLALPWLGALSSAAADDATAGATPLPRVALFTTGGTIQSKGAHRQTLMEYNAGKVTPDELLGDLPELASVAKLEVTEISNIGSGGIGTELLLKLAKSVNAALAEPGVNGAVVTHGTGTLEETAYFLNLTVRSDKPVVVVGAMRPFTAVSRDGPFNLYNAVRVAALPNAKGYGVMVLLNDTIHAARDVTKNNTYRVDTFVSRDVGPLGFADSDRISFYRKPLYRHTHRSAFDIATLETLPRVDVTYAYQDSDDTAIDGFVAAGADGIVVTGGSRAAIERGQKAGVLFVQSDRKGSGRVMQSARAAERGVVTSDNLPPHKARILLRLALTQTQDPQEIQRIFNEY